LDACLSALWVVQPLSARPVHTENLEHVLSAGDLLPLYIPEVYLVEITINQTMGQLTWTTVESFPLSGT